ncbi:Transcription initiation factor TFIID subunit 12 [Dictyocoela muelleri]|nr:Transcription initiation factor TFIID subunit 12 [Dictyocoela muelleri]
MPINHFLSRDKIVEFIKRITTQNVDKEVINNLQLFSEKFVGDILNRAILIAKHRNSNFVEQIDVQHILEREFDMCFGDRELLNKRNMPSSEHIDKIVDIKKQK